eukprot:GEZU01014408.1.p1 GENE.GEZU01014408.1~~GEZU01014408.1.p1  ORF type:complete len:320 (-),score=103.28 GEZU01014408.1:108-1067(-)
MDDCWAGERDAEGNIHPDAQAFPSGIAALADYVHSLGLKFGLYSDAGNFTCAGRPGSLGYEKNDANTYASWGVDYLKYDNCYNDNISPKVRYPIMRDALNATGRPIFFSMCEWGDDDPATWAAEVGNSWRTTGDIKDNWNSMLRNLDKQVPITKYAGPGGWNDPDMLEVGNGGMTDVEYQSHFSLWALLKAPLLIGCDITNMSAATKEILMNSEVIAVNQDPLGVSGALLSQSTGLGGALQVWGGPLSDGSFAVVLFNRAIVASKIAVDFSSLPGFPSNTLAAAVRDLWAHKDLGTFKGSFSSMVPAHGVTMVKVTPII